MAWLRIESDFVDHPKIRALSLQARWIHLQALCYCARLMTDGFVPDSVSRALLGRFQTASRELLKELWTPVEGGILVHDYLHYNPSKSEILQRKEANAKRQAEHRQREKVTRYSHAPIPSHTRREEKRQRILPRENSDLLPRGGLGESPSGPSLVLVPSGNGDGKIITPEDLMEAWNRLAPKCRGVRVLSQRRRRMAEQRLREGRKQQPPLDWEAAIIAMNESPFCTGFNDRRWKADFEFLCRPDRALWALEGRFSGAVLSGKANMNVSAMESFVAESWKKEG